MRQTNPAYLVLLSVVVGFYLGRSTIDPSSGDPREYYSLDSPDARVESPATASRSLAQQTSSSSIQEAGDGWHAVHVFYGNREALLAPQLKDNKGDDFSQEGQDRYALKLLGNKRKGFFVDLASNHPIKLSNTFLMEHEYAWDGLCIEPNWQYWNALAQLRKCKVIGAVGGGAVSKPIQFRMHPFKRFLGAFGGIVGDTFDNKPGEADKKKDEIEETRFTVALGDILETFNAPRVIDYMSLDVEGAEELILAEFPFDKWTFRVMNVERPSPNVRILLESYGYQLLRTDKYGDTVWKHHTLKTE